MSLQFFTKVKSFFFKRSLAYYKDTINAKFNPSGTLATIKPIAKTMLLIAPKPKETLKMRISKPVTQAISVTIITSEKTFF